ncbi:MAG: phosphodiesterase [Bacillota bacterium]|nr:phosphodiesterase [Bacillota bacterium]
MKIGVISDTHGSLPAWRAAFNRYFSDADLIIHCGDLFYHAPRNPLPEGYAPLALAEALNECRVPLVIARGNCDSAVDESLLKWPLAAPYAYARWEGRTVLAWHEGEVRPEAAEVVRRYKPDLFLVGHTHKGRVWRDGTCLCLNPGSPALSKLPGGRPTVGVVDDQGVRVLDLVTGSVVAESAWEQKEQE